MGQMKWPLSVRTVGAHGKSKPHAVARVKEAYGADQNQNKTFQALLKCRRPVNKAALWW